VQLLQHSSSVRMSQQTAAAFGSRATSKCPSIPYGDYMECGEGVQLCGVLTLETGEGTGYYHHDQPGVHGLWPEVAPYGNSACVSPQDPADLESLSSCYAPQGNETTESHQLDFQSHEWQKHGTCAGAANASDYFSQICNLAQGPLRVMAAARSAGLDLVDTADQLQRSGFCVWNMATEQQIELSACAGSDGIWKLAPYDTFSDLCKWEGPLPPEPTPSPAPTQCVSGQHGPPCSSDNDCRNMTGCIRCATSGFCTDVALPEPTPSPSPSPVPTTQCVSGQHGPPCSSDNDCTDMTGCIRCAKSGFCTDVPL